MPALLSVLNEASNPLDQIEELAMTNEWMVERDGDDEVNMIIEGGWTDMHLCINWHRELEGLHLACTFDLKIPAARREEVSRLAALINEQLYFGHFDVWRGRASCCSATGFCCRAAPRRRWTSARP
jgi:hypothetical protein